MDRRGYGAPEDCSHAAAPHRVRLAASMLYRGRDRARLARLAALAREADVPLIAVNDVLYHHPDRRPLADVLTCIREKTTIDRAGRKLAANAERHLKPPGEMARLFRDAPEAIEETLRLSEQLTFSLDELRYEYPDETHRRLRQRAGRARRISPMRAPPGAIRTACRPRCAPPSSTNSR